MQKAKPSRGVILLFFLLDGMQQFANENNLRQENELKSARQQIFAAYPPTFMAEFILNKSHHAYAKRGQQQRIQNVADEPEFLEHSLVFFFRLAILYCPLQNLKTVNVTAVPNSTPQRARQTLKALCLFLAAISSSSFKNENDFFLNAWPVSMVRAAEHVTPDQNAWPQFQVLPLFVACACVLPPSPFFFFPEHK